MEASEHKSELGQWQTVQRRADRQTEDRRVSAIPWADLATDCGYFDQAHLIKDFREFAGMTPNAFVRRMSFLI
jgi:AraC-like DNA-binding protein